MNSTNGLLKIGDFAKLANTNLRTLRYYEELGLLQPATRSQGGFRYYRESEIHRVALIHHFQALGLHLDRIRELMASRAAGEEREVYLARVRDVLQEHDKLLSQKVAVLEAQRAKVSQAVHKLNECRYCKHSPTPENNHCEPCVTTGESLPEFLSALYQ